MKIKKIESLDELKGVPIGDELILVSTDEPCTVIGYNQGVSGFEHLSLSKNRRMPISVCIPQPPVMAEPNYSAQRATIEFLRGLRNPEYYDILKEWNPNHELTDDPRSFHVAYGKFDEIYRILTE